jgi:predicted NBD/HSP70 family sugar kinase
MNNMYIAIDIGGTNARVASVDNLITPKIIKRASFKNTHNFNEYFSKIVNFIDSTGKIDGIGISIAGDLNKEKSMVVDSAENVPEVVDQPIVASLGKRFGCKVFMDNDGVAMALGEAIYGNCDKDKFVYLIWGTGIGGAIVKRKGDKIVVDQIDWFKHFEEWEYKCGGEAIKKIYGKPAKDISQIQWSKIDCFGGRSCT